jgi:hypothetical protein
VKSRNLVTGFAAGGNPAIGTTQKADRFYPEHLRLLRHIAFLGLFEGGGSTQDQATALQVRSQMISEFARWQEPGFLGRSVYFSFQ